MKLRDTGQSDSKQSTVKNNFSLSPLALAI